MSSSLVCVDANLVVRLVVDPTDPSVSGLWARWRAEQRQIAAPSMVLYEVTNGLYRYERAGTYSASAIRLMLQAALAMPLQLHGDPALHLSALAMAERFALPAAYDAHYLALAERLGAEFWTGDGRLARTVRPALSWVHLAGEQADPHQ
jgi:predicted nucleic acid-binding protein